MRLSRRATRLRVALTAMAVLATMAGGCSSSEPTTLNASRTSTSDGSAAATSSVSSTTTAENSAPTSVPSTAEPEESTTSEPTVCPAGDLPVGDSTTPTSAELDGDGSADTVYLVDGPGGWQLVVEFGGGGAVVSALVGTNEFDEPEVIGGADLDGDGVDELAVRVANGAYVALVSFVRVRDCSVIQLAFEDDSPAIFASGASAGGGEALLCNGDGTLERFFFSWLPGEDDETVEYEAGFQPFRLEGDVVVAFPGDGAGLTEDEVTELDLFDCLGLELVS